MISSSGASRPLRTRAVSGIGNELLAAAESRARDLPECVIRLYTGELLVDNVAWYQRRGYAIERHRSI